VIELREGRKWEQGSGKGLEEHDDEGLMEAR
jgi:hypothetical protein